MPYSKNLISRLTSFARKYKDILDPQFNEFLNKGDVRSIVNILIDVMQYHPLKEEIEFADLTGETKTIQKRNNLAKDAHRIYLRYISENPKDFSYIWFMMLNNQDESVKWSSHII